MLHMNFLNVARSRAFKWGNGQKLIIGTGHQTGIRKKRKSESAMTSKLLHRNRSECGENDTGQTNFEKSNWTNQNVYKRDLHTAS
jgi:hypothetical protein